MPLDMARLFRFNLGFWCVVAVFELANMLLEVVIWQEKLEPKYLWLSAGSLVAEISLTSALIMLAQCLLDVRTTLDKKLTA